MSYEDSIDLQTECSPPLLKPVASTPLVDAFKNAVSTYFRVYGELGEQAANAQVCLRYVSGGMPTSQEVLSLLADLLNLQQRSMDLTLRNSLSKAISGLLKLNLPVEC